MKQIPDWPYFVFWMSSLSGGALLLLAIIWELRRIIVLLEGLQ